MVDRYKSNNSTDKLGGLLNKILIFLKQEQRSKGASMEATMEATVSTNTAAVIIQAENSDRKGLVVLNTDANDLYIGYTSDTTAAKNVAIVAQDGHWTMPADHDFQGDVYGIWADDGVGVAAVTELI